MKAELLPKEDDANIRDSNITLNKKDAKINHDDDSGK